MKRKDLYSLSLLLLLATVSLSLPAKKQEEAPKKEMHGKETTVLGLRVSCHNLLGDTLSKESYTMLDGFKPAVIQEAYRKNKAEAVSKLEAGAKEGDKAPGWFKVFGQQFANYFSDNSLTPSEELGIAVPWLLVLFLFLCYRAAKIFKRVDELDAYTD